MLRCCVAVCIDNASWVFQNGAIGNDAAWPWTSGVDPLSLSKTLIAKWAPSASSAPHAGDGKASPPSSAPSSLCLHLSEQVAPAKLPSLPLADYPQLKLGGNFYGAGGHQTSLRECLFANGTSFGWNWTRGATHTVCTNPTTCKSPACYADFSLMDVGFGVSPFGGHDALPSALPLPANLSGLDGLVVGLNATWRYRDDAPGVAPPPVGGVRRTRLIVDFFLSAEKPNGSDVSHSITDEVTIALAANAHFPGSQPPGCLDNHSRFGNTSTQPVLRNAVWDGFHHYDFFYTGAQQR